MRETGVIFALIRDKKILMQQRDEHCPKFPLMWCLPGGGSEEGESREETLLREVKEEYDIDLELSQCTHFMDYNDGADNVYICKINSNQEPRLGEGKAMKWMTIEEIEQLDLGFHQAGIIPVLKTVTM